MPLPFQNGTGPLLLCMGKKINCLLGERMGEIRKEDIKSIECKNVFYSKSKTDSTRDMVFIKEQIHLKDGRSIPNTRIEINPEREFYVTREGIRKEHKQKRLFEDMANVRTYKTTQANLSRDISRALGMTGYNPGLSKLSDSPYLYGTDVSIQALTKYKYMERWPDSVSPNSVAVLDIETDVFQDNEFMVSCSLTYKNHAIVAIWEKFVEGYVDVEERVKELAWEYIPEAMRDRNIDLEVVLCKTSGECAQRCFERAHAWKPDFVLIWNINFDLKKIMKRCKLDGIDLDEMFSDPSVPPEFRNHKYNEGPEFQITASGVKKNLAPFERWHYFSSPASFYIIDAMVVYYKLRVAAGKEGSYALDPVLERRLGIRKLKFKQADHIPEGLPWHEFMQTHFKLEYLIYNLWDCISVEMLDEQEKDISTKISILCKQSEVDLFPRQPKRTAYSLHFYAKKMGKVIASTPTEIPVEDDKWVVSTEGWIQD